MTWDKSLLHSISKHSFGITPAQLFDVQSHTLLVADKLHNPDFFKTPNDPWPQTPGVHPTTLHGLLRFCSLHQGNQPRWKALHREASECFDADRGGGGSIGMCAPEATVLQARTKLAALHCVNLRAMLAVLDQVVYEAAETAPEGGAAASPPLATLVAADADEEEIAFDAHGAVKLLRRPLSGEVGTGEEGLGPVREAFATASESIELLDLLGILQVRVYMPAWACLSLPVPD